MNGENSLAVIQQAKTKGALVFINAENFQSQTELYKTETTLLNLSESDFHDIGGAFSPKKETVDRIGEASGVMFIPENCKVTQISVDDAILGRHTVFHGEAQSKVRLSDGSWRTSSVCDYDFDPTLRACLDKNVFELNEKTKPLVAKRILEYTKFGAQRANTGARLRVIKELTGMPTAFSKEQVRAPMMFGRIAQNTSYILGTPEGRAMATAQALGVDMSTLFGGKKVELAAQEQTAAVVDVKNYTSGDENTASETIPDFDTTDGTAQQTGQAEFERLTASLEEWREEYKDILGAAALQLIDNELGSFEATPETRSAMIERIKNNLAKRGVLK